MAPRIPALSNAQKLNKITADLPECTQQYFYSGTSGKSILTRISYALDIRYFLDYLIAFAPSFLDKKVKELSIDDFRQIETSDINDFIKWMAESEHLSERTRARRRSSISGLYEYLINIEKRLEHNPVSGSASIEIPENDRVTYLNLKEQEKLLSCIKSGTDLTGRQLKYHEKYKKRDLAIIFLFLDTGLRISELQALNVSDVVIYEDLIDDNKSECYVLAVRKDRKNSLSTTKIYFSDESKEYIQDYLDSRKGNGEVTSDNSPLFATTTGKRLSIREIQQMLKKYVSASLDRNDISIGKLRSSFAMEFYKHEKNILILQQRLGHKSLTATNIYARASDREEAVKNSRNWRQNKN